MSKAAGPYSPSRRAGDWLAISGQLGLKDGAFVAEDTVAQCRQAMENLKALVEAEGGTMDQIMKCNLYIIDMSEFTAVNEVYVTYFNDPKPARACVSVAELPLGGRFEIEAWAYLGS